MFNNIIYFIIVLLIFNIGVTDGEQTKSLAYSMAMIATCWLALALLCRFGFKRLVGLYEKGGASSSYSTAYNRLVLRLSIASVFVFSLDIFAFNLKYWLEHIPVIGNVYTFQGVSVIILFLFYMGTIWYFAHPAYNRVFNSDIKKQEFVLWNIKLNIPVILPWLFLSLVFDLVTISPWPALNSFMDKSAGQILFFCIFLVIAMVFLPVLIQYFWGCKPLEASQKADSIRSFLTDIGFRYKALVNWPFLGGTMMTAGIMGIVPRYRYLLITESLMDILSISELKAVMAHEAGHAKYKHQLFLSLFFLTYSILILGFFNTEFYFTVMGYLLTRIPGISDNVSDNVYFVFIAIPMLASLIIYFRFIMGFFMRHFERQADTYSAIIIGDPTPIINSLEKIALFSGKTRNAPSWHHFSIKQRVEFLEKSHHDPSVFSRHRRLLRFSFVIYLSALLSLMYVLYMTPLKENITNSLISSIVMEKVDENPDDIELLRSAAMAYHEMERFDNAVEIYERILVLNRNQPTALNNLAWIILTTDDSNLRDVNKGFKLAKEAVELERSAIFLDTLAEACWLNNNHEMAVRLIEEAILMDDTGNTHYLKQLDKFRK